MTIRILSVLFFQTALIFSAQAHASEEAANTRNLQRLAFIQKAVKILPQGEYTGQTPYGRTCVVSVKVRTDYPSYSVGIRTTLLTDFRGDATVVSLDSSRDAVLGTAQYAEDGSSAIFKISATESSEMQLTSLANGSLQVRVFNLDADGRYYVRQEQLCILSK